MDISFRKLADVKNVLRRMEDEKNKYDFSFPFYIVDNGDGISFDTKSLLMDPNNNPHLETTIKGAIIAALSHARPGYNFSSQGDGIFKASGFHGRIGSRGHLDDMDQIIDAYMEIIKRGLPSHVEMVADMQEWDVESTSYMLSFEIRLT